LKPSILAIVKKSGAGKVRNSTPGAIPPGSEPLKKIIKLFFIPIITAHCLKSTILKELSGRIKRNIKIMLGYINNNARFAHVLFKTKYFLIWKLL
jgi:hypothetical protein